MTGMAAALRAAARDPLSRVHLSRSRRARTTRCGIRIARERGRDGRRLTETRGESVVDRAGIVNCGRCLGVRPEGRIR